MCNSYNRYADQIIAQDPANGDLSDKELQAKYPDLGNVWSQYTNLLQQQKDLVNAFQSTYGGADVTGMDEGYARGIEIVFNKRDHSFSSSSLRKRVAAAESMRVLKSEPDREKDYPQHLTMYSGILRSK